MIKVLMIIGTGGFIGSISRYLTQQLVQERFDTSFPLGTMVVNIIGSFIIGIVYALSEKGDVLSPEWRLFLAVGFCGGFTTFSSFAYENFQMMKMEQFFFVALYMGLSLFLGILATYLGVISIKLI
jgi:CrcB protein